MAKVTAKKTVVIEPAPPPTPPAERVFHGSTTVRWTGANWQEVGGLLRRYQYLPERKGGKIIVNDGTKQHSIIAGKTLKISAERIVVV